MIMKEHYNIETSERLYSTLTKFKQVMKSPLNQFKPESMREVQAEIFDALPDVKKWFETDESHPEWDEEQFNKFLAHGGNQAAWDFAMTIQHLGVEDINPVVFINYADAAYYGASDLASWLHPDVYGNPQGFWNSLWD